MQPPEREEDVVGGRGLAVKHGVVAYAPCDLSAADHDPHREVGVPGDVLGRRVRDDVDPVLERAEIERRPPGGVAKGHDAAGAAGAGDAGDVLDLKRVRPH